ncbi:MAG: DUF3277 family protein [Burkholderiaceae bacterium]|nr:DUF3277 family protein [Burkholderiaceae bacterium]
MRFDPKLHSVLINGYEINGWAKGGDVVSYVYNSDAGALTVGARGGGVFVANQDRSTTLTLKLLQHSPDNKFLQRLSSVQRNDLKAFVPLTLAIRDLINEDRASGVTGFFTTLPGLVRGDTANDTTHVIVFTSGNIVLEDGVA